jgi:hypothetical protein
MKFSTATATVVGVAAAAAAAAIMIPGPTAAKELLDQGAWPEDAHAIRHCIAPSCGNFQAPDALKCRAWCLEVSGEKQRRQGGRKWRRQEASGWALRNKHELELDHVGLRVKHGLGPGEDHVGLKVIHGRGSEDQGLKIMHKIGPEEEEGVKVMHKLDIEPREEGLRMMHKIGPEEEEGVKVMHEIGPEEEESLKVMHKLDIEPRDADGALEAREVELVETGVVDDDDHNNNNNNNNSNGRGAFGSLPGPVLTGVAKALRTGTNGKADEVDTADVRHGRLGRRASAAASDRSTISTDAQAILDQHNSHRTNHSAPAFGLV